jgi:membrane protein
MGHQTAEVLQSAIASAAEKSSGIIATIIGVAVLIATASGVFGEMQAALNAIWKANPQTTTVSQLIRARAVSLGLVAALGFLLIVSLAISAGLTAFGDYLDTVLPMGKLILPVLNFVVSVLLLAILFGAITDCVVYWQQRSRVELRRGRRPYCVVVVGLLLRSNILTRS